MKIYFNKNILLTLLLIATTYAAQAREIVGMPLGGLQQQNSGAGKTTVANCNPTTAFLELNINNVRTRLLNGGDMWWNPVAGDAKYQVPKLPIGEKGIHSIFAGALWIGGIDANQQLKVAAQTYRQNGNDFFAGPLSENGETDVTQCGNWDKMWEVKKTDIDAFKTLFEAGGNQITSDKVPESLLKWPGRNNPYFEDYSGFELPEDKDLAPFWDFDGDGNYNPTAGDYPVIDPRNGPVYADQMIWWIFNDWGNAHSESGGEPIGLEVGALAFAFATNDEVNNMTFYSYKVNNYSTVALNDTYFGQWVDPDLGNYSDDFVGCIADQGLGIVYNGDANDEGANGYGVEPPMLGVDFFKGPAKIDPITGDTTILGMSAFVYFNNDGSVTGNPFNAGNFYGYLDGKWKDNTPITEGGNGYGGTTPTKFMFPGDPTESNAWSECSEGNDPADRRFVQSSGPFTLMPGAKNDVIVGVVWVRDGLKYPCPSFDIILNADTKAQALFDNGFKLKDGPDAPDLTIRELDQELILTLQNKPNSNNYKEGYKEKDPVLFKLGVPDPYYYFEGYKIYQLRNGNVSLSSGEYDKPENADKVRLVAQVDLKNDVTRIINYTYNSDLQQLIPEEKVLGTNTGVERTFSIKKDQFAEGDDKLINQRRYFFTAVTYAYSPHTAYTPETPNLDKNPQLEPYLLGRNNLKVYTGIPHKTQTEAGGTILNSSFGDSPEIVKIKGKGNGDNPLMLTDASIQDILTNAANAQVIYKSGEAPITIKIIDPMKVPASKFRLTLTNAAENDTVVSYQSRWKLEDINSGEVYNSDTTIVRANEQVFTDLGLLINLHQTQNPSYNAKPDTVEVRFVKNGFIDANLKFKENNQWLTFIGDSDGEQVTNWIRSGNVVGSTQNPAGDPLLDDAFFSANRVYDYNQYYETILGGGVAPYCLSNSNAKATQNGVSIMSPACSDCKGNADPEFTIPLIPSFHLVLTPDKTKWTKCSVVEIARDKALAEGEADKNTLRKAPSKDKDGNETNSVNSLEANQKYCVLGTSASGIKYTENGQEKTAKAGAYFKTTESTNFQAINGAKVYKTDDIGMSWFPGYAINLETGERLNLMFSENSFFAGENGNDLLWNPTDRLKSDVSFGSTTYKLGGEHYIYVMNSAYDEGNLYHQKLSDIPFASNATAARAIKNSVYKEGMWVAAPILTEGFKLKSLAEGIIPTEASITVRVEKQYEQANATDRDLVYEFDLSKYAAKKADIQTAVSALDWIKAVPNPYYGYSQYEDNAVNNKILITNLPTRANISIFTPDGTLIRTIKFEKPNADTSDGSEVGKETKNSAEWDLKNTKGVPISGGLYFIHLDFPELGQSKTLKWFGVMRPTDLDIF